MRADRIAPSLAPGLVVALGLACTGPARAEASAPFHERPVLAAQAASLALIAVRAEAIAIAPEEAGEAAEALEADLARVLASLRRADADAADALARAVAALEDAGSAADRARAAAAVKQAATRAEAALLPTRDAPLAGAVASILLVSEAGLAETYEEAVEGEEGAYALAYAALGRVRAILAGVSLREAMSESVAADAAELTARLDELLPTPEAPARLSSDPEAAEVFAQALVGVIEGATDADLYLGRDLARALATVRGLAEAGCAAADPALGREAVAIAAFYHEDALEAPLGVLATAAAEEAEQAYDDLLAAAAPPAAACAALVEAYAAAAATLFPGRAL